MLVVLDWLAPTSLMAVFEMTAHLSEAVRRALTGAAAERLARLTALAPDAAVVPEELSSVSRGGRRRPLPASGRSRPRVVAAPGSAVRRGPARPADPPCAAARPRLHLLAWSAADADFWRSGRTDVQTQVVGSQLLWEASQGHTRVTDDRPTFLGQLHSAEMGRREMARFTGAFCRTEGTRYRPHPGERDRLSRWQHARWRRQGIEFDDGSVPLRELPTPVVSVFSTGILEAAARGVPAWAAYDRPPAWLAEFWERYAMSRYGSDPTPAPAPPEREPAVAVAAAVEELL